MSQTQRDALDRQLRAPRPDPPQSIPALREWFEQQMAEIPLPPDARTTATSVAGRDALLVEPDPENVEPRRGTILYLHGGAYVIGSPRTSLSITAHLVARTGMRSVSLDYRLAPEHPFPAGIEDALAAYRALLDAGTAASEIVFAGDSAGGGIAMGALLAARDAGVPLPAGYVGFSPGLDATRSGESFTTKVDADPILSPALLSITGPLYRGDADAVQPWLSPAVHADLTGLPPLLLQVGTNELLLDDARRMATRASDQGVDAILDITAGVPHVFPLYAHILDEAGEALDRAALFIRQRVG